MFVTEINVEVANSVLRIWDVYPGSEFFLSRIQVQKIPASASKNLKNLSVLTLKIVSKLSEL